MTLITVTLFYSFFFPHNISSYLLLFPVSHTALLLLFTNEGIAGVAYVFSLSAIILAKFASDRLVWVDYRARITWTRMRAELYSG